MYLVRALHQFSWLEWAKLKPLADSLKQVRNDLWMQTYRGRAPRELESFIEQVRHLAGRAVLVVIAFEQPWALDWLLAMAKRHVEDATAIVLDNSRSDGMRGRIAEVCRAHGTPCLGLPANSTTHVNRSHGMAMNWGFYNVVRRIRPSSFAFIDHDLIPLQKIRMEDKLGDQPIYGMRLVRAMAWQLWAGYCMYDFARLGDRPLNFLYDFSLGLDTGGRNWPRVYRDLDPAQLRFAHSDKVEIKDPVSGEAAKVQWVDDAWFHIGGVSYNDNFRSKALLSERLAHFFSAGGTWQELVKS